MAYPDNPITIPDGEAPYVARRDLDADELAARLDLERLLGFIGGSYRATLRVFRDGSNGHDLAKSLFIDATSYCRDLIAEIDAIPEAEAREEEARLSDEAKWGV